MMMPITVSREHIESICNEILFRNIKIKWECMGRVDAVDKKTVELYEKAGCDVIFSDLSQALKNTEKHQKKCYKTADC